MSIKEIAKLKIEQCDIGENITIEDYLKQLLLTVWKEVEGFSGKRPFGNSGWQWDVYACLVKSKAAHGTLDEDGYVETCNRQECDKIIEQIISSFTAAPKE